MGVDDVASNGGQRCSPRQHRMPLHLGHDGGICVSMTWRAITFSPCFVVQLYSTRKASKVGRCRLTL